MPIIECYVQTLNQTYAGTGLPRVEVFVSTGYTNLIPIPSPGQEVPITLVATNGTYQGGLRDNQGKGWPYICPDLTKAGGDEIKLAEILRDNGIPLVLKQPVRFNVSGTTWTLI